MIKRIAIENFKSLREVDLTLGQVNLFVGTNASGKSNLLDALRVLRLLAGGFTIKGLFEGGVQTTRGETWHGHRGGLPNAIYRGPGAAVPAPGVEARLEVELTTELGGAAYRIGFNRQGATTRERLAQNGHEIFSFDGHDASFRIRDGISTHPWQDTQASSQLIAGLLAGLAGPHKEFVGALVRALQNAQFLEPQPDVLRGYGVAAEVKRMGEHGENFASIVSHICSDPKTKASYLNWLRELRPREVDDVRIISRGLGEPLFALSEAGREFPAPALSDGTLRFAALTAAFFQPLPPEILVIEEVENGIHGTRLRLLLELLRSQSAAAKTQVLATTHSPLLLAWLTPEEHETTFLCKRDEETGEARILPLTQVPHFKELVGKQPITELLTEGWLEAAV